MKSLIKSLTPRQRDLLFRRLRESAGGAAGRPEIPRRPPGQTRFPLAFAQQRLWFLDQLEPGSDSYAMPFALEFEGALDVGALRASLDELVRRHEALRTVFRVEGDEPMQVVLPELRLELPVLPWDTAALEREASRGFDLATGPLVRAVLFVRGARRHVVLLAMHHIVSDVWSMGVLVREMSALYEAFHAGQPSPLPELEVQYADYSCWQREWLAGERLERQLAYWTEQLAGPPAALELPADRPRPPVQTYAGATHRFSLTPELTDALKAIASQRGATPFMVLMAGFKVFLHRYTGQSDLAVGTPVANRSRSEVEGLIGFFVNTLVLRTQVDGTTTFAEAIDGEKAAALAAFAHQSLPFERLVEALQPERDQSRSPLVQVVFALQNAPVGELRLTGLSLRPVELPQRTAKFDLSLHATAGGDGGYDCLFEFNTDLFDRASVERWAAGFVRLLEAAVAAPARAVGELEVLAQGERQTLLVEWNESRSAYPERTAVELFEEQARARPDAVAVLFEQSRLTYGELNARANRLAHALRLGGVGPEDMVGLAIERSLEMVIAVLGILKAGAAYVPLDPLYPRERTEWVKADARLSTVVVKESLPESGPEDDPAARLTPDNAAYVMYTSGSTGRPKGVVVTHRAIVRLVRGTNYARLGEDETILQAGPLAFDASTFELWGALLNGGRVALMPPGPPSPEALTEAIGKHGVSTLFLTTALFHAAIPSGDLGRWRSLRQLLTGGDVVSPASFAAARTALPGCAISVVYGPTEATTFSSHYPPRGESIAGPAMPIGWPLANAQLFILDAALRPVPVGVAGELYIGGDGLARGYLNRPALTADRFIPDGLSGKTGARLYRTGDRCRYRPDGGIEFLGRADHQFKLRGYRIELGEVEAALREHTQEAVALVRGEGDDKRLVGWYVGDIEPAALRARLSERVPEYMVPSALVRLAAIPVTPNGKVDGKALPEPETDRAALGSAYAAPRTPLEAQLCALWAEVLGAPQVGIHDDFFALGGHSLKATQLVSRVRSALGAELPLRALFAEPTPAGLAAALERAQGGMDAGPALAARPPGASTPLSFAQQRLWFLDQLEPGSSGYNISVALQLTGALDVAALRGALDEVVRRHEALRTVFSVEADAPVQVVRPELHLELPVSPWEESAAEKEATRGFDLATGPLVRAALYAQSPDRHVLLLTMHHIVSDGWSLGVLAREVAALYSALCAGEPSPLPDLPIQYRDYASWQREWLAGERLERQLAYWKERLAGPPAALELPTDRPRPPVQTYAGATHRTSLTPELTSALEALARQRGATLFMVLMAGFKAFLHRYTGQSDLAVGTPIANRGRSELEGLIGFFVNTLVLRTQVDGATTFAQALEREKEAALLAYAHQDLPFERLVEALQPERDQSRSPLFQVLFALQNAPLDELRLGAVSLHPVELPLRTAKFDLSLHAMENAGGLDCTFEYNTDLFDHATIERMAAHWQRLLSSAAGDPGRRIGELELLSESDRRRLLVDWNDTAAAFPHGLCIHQLLEAQANRTPGAVAVESEGSSLTYAQLEARANQLAHHLISRGVGPEVRVGVCAERSLEMVVGLLGVLKAGGAYVPLDPSYPSDRLAFMLADSRVPVLLTQARLLPRLQGHAARAVCLDRDAALLDALPASAPRCGVAPENLAYVIYTSGSTGRPKGACNEHRGVVNRLLWTQAAFRLGADDVVLQKTPFSFDVSVWEFFWPLMAGARLVMARPEGHKDRAYLIDEIAARGVTTLHFVPSMLGVFLDGEDLERCASLRRVLCSGEALSAEHVRLFHERLPCQLHNLYGPTEAAVDVTWWPCERGVRRPSVPIGRPIANTRTYVLADAMSPVPIGTPGELYLGGVQVGRGYLDRPALTAERFLPDPFCTQAGGRVYRTGDLARWRPDGTIDYLGRVDHQVKLRGFRIELGEIEAALAAVPGVQSSVVVARDEPGGGKYLVGYVGAADGISTSALHQALSARLPDYMVPSVLVALPALPLSPNGKIDRKALPEPKRGADGALAYHAPRTPQEELLAGCFQELLGVPRVGIHDDFFALGGHSLKATQLVSRVRSALGAELPLRALFAEPTVAGLAAALERAQGGMDAGPALVARPPGAATPLSFAQQRLWFLDQLEPWSGAYNVPIALEMTGALDVAALRGALDELVRRHEALRTVFRVEGGAPAQVVLPELHLELPISPWEESAAEKEATRGFDLVHGPLIRAALYAQSPDRHVLLLTMHHIVSDGWSLGVMAREVAALYSAFHAGEPSPLPELAIQYADYACWQREWLSGERLERQLAYWKERLAGPPLALELPTDRPRPPVQTYGGATHRFSLTPELTSALKALARERGATLFMVLMAGWKALLHRYTGQSDLAVGTPIANRGRSELEGLIGFFVNTLVLRTQIDGATTFAQAMVREKEAALLAYAHQDLPFERLVEALQPERDQSRSPLFQVSFALQNAPLDELRLGAVSLHPVELPQRTAKFDLSLHALENAGGLECTFEYNTDLFDRATVQRMAGHYLNLLMAVVAHPERRLGELEIVGADERRWVASVSAGARVQDASTELLPERIAGWAARTPEAVALECDGRRASYAELHARAQRVSGRLRELGVGAEARVGVCAPRSLEALVGVLGVLGAGGAYVPLDPGYPGERLAYMLADSGARVLLSVRSLEGQLPAFDGQVLWLDEDSQWSSFGSGETGVSLWPEQLAYVIYTSGSTGRPKGVGVSHANLLHSTRARWERYAQQVEGFLMVSSLSFDSSVAGVFWTLSQGGRLCLPGEGQQRDVEGLVERLAQGGITHLLCLPSLYEQLLEQGGERLRGLRAVIVAGESCPGELVSRHTQRLPGTEFYNEYGPTEGTVWSTVWQALSGASEAVTIGRVIPGASVWVLDGEGRVCPAGVSGEIHIGGAGVTRGYVGRAELTAERFVPDPFGQPGERMYRTGDLARRRPDGSLVFLGRLDHQVKVRGFRIEPGEIEAALSAVPGVAASVVVVRADGAGQQRLVGYVGAPHPAVTPALLRATLLSRLPDYMVPATIVVLPALPLSPNGKIDRQALPEPDRAVTGTAYAAPRTPLEEQLCALWAEVLGAGQVGIHDDFFALGGHSLKATQLVSRVRSALVVELPLRALFATPTPAGLAAELERAQGGMDAGPALVARPPGASTPLSFAQQRLWFLDQLEPWSGAYNVPIALEMTGALDVVALRGALDELVRRHEALRTVFRVEGGAPAQVVLPELHLELPISPWEESAAEKEATRGFDLAHGPLIRAALYAQSPDRHVLLLTMHHIVSDGWSLGVLAREVAALYSAFGAGEPSPLPELEVQYRDYACWQREWLSGERLERQLAYWKERLAGPPLALELPTDRPRPPVQTYGGATHRFSLTPELTDALKTLARERRATLFMVLMAGFKAFLHRYTGQSDLAVGTPIANRGRSEVEGLVGCFVNTLVLRTQVDGATTFAQALEREKEAALLAYAHQDLPFERLVEALQPERDQSRSPLFQVLFALQNAPAAELRLEGLSMRPVELPQRTAKFDLSLHAMENAGGLECTFEYNTDLFDHATIERMAAHWQRLLSSAAGDPGRRVGDLELLSQAEQRQALWEWNDTAAEFPRDACIHQLFEARAAQAPHAVALESSGARLTYAQLDARATRLAQRLISLGVGPEVRVGICAERCPDLVAGLLGVLKAGGAYLPLDPHYPGDRLAFMLADARASVLLTQRKLVGQLPPHGARVLLLDGEGDAGPSAALGAAPLAAAVPENLAYLIYTSGSTGRPKGVAITHRNAVALIAWAQRAYGAHELARVLASTSVCFDLSIFELFSTLAAGGTVVLVQSALELIERKDLAPTLINTVPSAMAELVRAGAVPASARVANLAGEPLSQALVAKLARETAVRRIWDLYGPSEDTTYSTGAIRTAEAPASIGRSLDNKRSYVLDAALRPSPIGVRGELYVAGLGLARGYLDRPELTAERFVPDPFGQPGERMYRTGDLARRRPDGSLVFLGRLDHQVKVRGFRIEPGEIEAALSAVPGVAASVVVARADGAGQQRLVGYVGAEDPALTPELLRATLLSRLPDYMVPATIVVLPALPLLPNGKIDRQALPEPDRAATGAAYAAPRTPLEEQLCALWAEVLGAERVGIHDDFFALGGHSLLLLTLQLRVRQQLGAEVEVRALLSAPTVSGLAGALAAGQQARARPACVVPLGEERGTPLFCVHPAGGDVFGFKLLAERMRGCLFYGLQSPGLLGEREPFSRMEDLAAHYFEAIRQVQPRGPYRLAGWSLGAHVAVEVARQLLAAGEQVALCALLDADPAAGAAARAALSEPGAFENHSFWLAGIAEYFERLLGRPLPISAAALARLAPDEQLRAFVAAVAQVAGDRSRPPTLAELRRVLAVYKANMRALIEHVPRSYPGRLTLLLAEGALSQAAEIQRGWSLRTSEPVATRTVPGDHYTLLALPHVDRLAAVLDELMAGGAR